MGIPALATWATLANYPAGANPWNGQPTKIQPAQAYFVPALGASATEMNYELNQLKADVQGAYNHAISAALASWSAKALVTGSGVGQASQTAFGGFVFDAFFNRWVGATTGTVAGANVSLCQSFDGGRTWSTLYAGSNNGLSALALTQDPRAPSVSSGIMLLVDGTAGGWTAHAITPAGVNTSTTRVNTFTSATAFWMDVYFWVFGVNQLVAGTYTGFLEHATAAGTAWTDNSAALPAAFASGTNHVPPLLSAVGLVSTTPTAVIAMCATTAGTDTPKLMKMTEVAGTPTCTDITAAAASALATGGNKQKIVGLAYGANDGLWGLLTFDSTASVTRLWTSPDLATWTNVWVSPNGSASATTPQGLGVVGSVWAICGPIANSATAGYSVQLSQDVAAAALAGTVTATFHGTSSNLQAVADGLGGLYSSGNQLLVASDTAVAISGQVGFP